MKIFNTGTGIVKSDFDLMIQYKDLEVVTEAQMNERMPVFEKADSNLLTAEEQDLLKSFVDDLVTYQKYTVLEDTGGLIKRTNVFVRERQFDAESIEKGEFGEIVKGEGTGKFIDTELNRSLNRVGESFEF